MNHADLANASKSTALPKMKHPNLMVAKTTVGPSSIIDRLLPPRRVARHARRLQASLSAGSTAANAAPLLTASTQPSAAALHAASRSPISMVITNGKQSIKKAMRRMLLFELYNAEIWRSTNALVKELLCQGIVSEQQLGVIKKDIPTWRGRALAYARDRLNTVGNGTALFEIVRALSGLDGVRR
ncbi:hypothetical protein K470DRAFT_257238 [Piedraia hortae CBS 480.64]|uniref:Uncharacterized protein n=1 Tax=Piedraia hortae CBS 480.64 TaxID=1314780 RepID=A0A6A7C0R7_9PEZI|nr:hypothetical protein K470DRAFT_257238 [Piedraia hortae CBS 480.64]